MKTEKTITYNPIVSVKTNLHNIYCNAIASDVSCQVPAGFFMPIPFSVIVNVKWGQSKGIILDTNKFTNEQRE